MCVGVRCVYVKQHVLCGRGYHIIMCSAAEEVVDNLPLCIRTMTITARST